MSGERESLDAGYFDGVFDGDDDPWGLASSPYEAAKFAHTHAVLSDRRYRRAFEVGCAHGVLTETLAPLCESLLAVDISARALRLAAARLGARSGVTLRRVAFPHEAPTEAGFDLVILSEVAYYWSDEDLRRAAAWISGSVARGGRLLLVHYTETTDYPQGGDEAVDKLWRHVRPAFDVDRAERRPRYRLDLWVRR